MADIKLVIKIDEEYLEDIKERVKDGDIDYEPWVAIANGIPLPKGHGKLIDADKLKQKIEMADDNIVEEDWYKLYDSVISDIVNAPAIIKVESEGNG